MTQRLWIADLEWLSNKEEIQAQMSWFTMQAIYLVALNLCPLKSSKCLFKSKKFVYIGWMLPFTALIPFVSLLNQLIASWLLVKIMINVQYRYKDGFHNKKDYCWLKPLNKFNTSISNDFFEEFSTDYTLLPVVIFNVATMCLNLILFIIIIFQIYFNHWFKILIATKWRSHRWAYDFEPWKTERNAE